MVMDMGNGEVTNSPLITVVTPAYNSENFIGETIMSVINQTYKNWEMIIVDDFSNDDTVNIIKKIQDIDNRIKLVQTKENNGPAVARNIALNMARGRFIAFLDSDDLWTPEKLEKQLNFMIKKNIAFSFTQYVHISESGEEGNIVRVPNEVSYHDLLKHNMIGCLTVMIDTHKTGKIQMVNLRTRQDYVLWLYLCKKGFIAHGLQETLAKYRNVTGSISSNKWKVAIQNWKVYREVENLNIVYSTWYFINYLLKKTWKYTLKR